MSPVSVLPAPSAPPVGREDHEQRLLRARSVLQLAERSAAEPAGTVLPVPQALTPLFPHAGLRVGSSLAVTGSASTSMLLALASAAAGERSWCAVAGMPDLGLRCAVQAGLDPARLAIVPAQETQTPQILSALVDGVGVLVLGPELALTPALWRSLGDRARSRDVLVLAADPPGRSDLVMETSAQSWVGLGHGSGRLRSRRVLLELRGRGVPGQRRLSVLMPHVAGGIVQSPGRAPLRLHERRAG